MRSVVSDSGLETGPVDCQILDGPEQDGQFERLSVGSEVSSTGVGICAVNTGACDGAQENDPYERLPLRVVLFF